MRSYESQIDLWSIGHSLLEMSDFLGLLKKHDITAIADVRSVPFSRRAPWFSQSELKEELRAVDIAYSFLGSELGGRPKSPTLLKQGVADYDAMAKTPEFNTGVTRLLTGATRYRVAMMCSEADPLHCHRCLLVARSLAPLNVETRHILRSGNVETQEEAQERLLREEHLEALDMITSDQERLEEAYHRRTRQVAYSPAKARVLTHDDL